MDRNWRLNGFYNAGKLTGLFEAVSHRQSCRIFSAAPSTAQWNALLTAADQLALPGVRIALGLCDTSLFQPFMGLLMKFENVQRFAAVIATDDNPVTPVNAGISGEMFMLKAVENGLGGCWVTGTYKRAQVGLQLDAHEKLLGLIALGIPKTMPSLPVQRSRKALTALCPDFESLNHVFREIIQYVREAPSAVNMQPWRFSPLNDKVLAMSVARPAQRLDLGIGLSHAVLALGSTPALFSVSEDGLCAHIELV